MTLMVMAVKYNCFFNASHGSTIRQIMDIFKEAYYPHFQIFVLHLVHTGSASHELLSPPKKQHI